MTLIGRLKARTHSVQGAHTSAELSEAERRLGFPLPDFLREVYLEVGYGWPLLSRFGLSSVWQALKDYQESLADAERGMPIYPQKLLPIVQWGCGIESVIDCSSPGGPIIRIDPNFDVPYILDCFDLSPDFKFYEAYSNSEIASWYEAMSLSEWLEAWLHGVNLFELPMKMRVKDIDPYCN